MESKNNIKKRMIVQAANVWGISSKEVEKSDPLVPLLLDACAGEISNISKSIDESREKIGSKIMELLTPDELTSPYPARAIVTAVPMEVYCDINEDNQFYYNKKDLGSAHDQDIEIYFTPTSQIRLLKGEVRYIASHNKICSKNGPFEITEFCNIKGTALLDQNTLWIGLHIAKPVQSLEGISFYFDLNPFSETEGTLLYKALSASQWDICGQKLSYKCGVGLEDLEDIKFHLINVDREFCKSRAVCHHVNNYYKKKFFTLTQNQNEVVNLKELTRKYPESFTEVFKEDKLKEIEGNLVWIRIAFTQHIPHEVLRKVNCSINCFPVINRRAEKVNVTAKNRIVGLKSEKNEMYLDLKKIRTDNNLNVILDENKKVATEKTAVLTLRKDNIGRFNSRNALELIQQMIDVYREEFLSFSKFKNINQDAIENLKNAILPFESLLDDSQDIPLDSMPFIMLKTDYEMDDLNVEVEYWLTNGSMANNISREECLRYDSSDLIRDKIFLMTTTSGGINKKRNEEIAHDFRYALLTRDRVVTKSDIRALCFKVFQNVISEVEIKEGIVASTLPNTGLRRTIDIHLKISTESKPDEESIKFLKEDLLTRLEEKSSNLLPFRIFIEHVQG